MTTFVSQLYWKICSKETLQQNHFYSNSLLSVWEGLVALNNDSSLNVKNVILYRLNLSEKKTWRQYKGRGNTTDANQITYNSSRWIDLDLDYSDFNHTESDFLTMNHFECSIDLFSRNNREYAEVIQLLAIGYTSKEAFQLIYNTKEYTPRERKKMERIKKQFKNIYKQN